jgi:hypothetical protein
MRLFLASSAGGGGPPISIVYDGSGLIVFYLFHFHPRAYFFIQVWLVLQVSRSDTVQVHFVSHSYCTPIIVSLKRILLFRTLPP